MSICIQRLTKATHKYAGYHPSLISKSRVVVNLGNKRYYHAHHKNTSSKANNSSKCSTTTTNGKYQQKRIHHFFSIAFNPHSPGGTHPILSRPVLSSLRTRIPAAILILFLVQQDDIPLVPFAFDYMAGPSMLPTIFPVGDCYFRWKGWWFNQLRNSSRQWQVGDVVVFKDSKGNRACKRIIGIEGDAVDKLGQYVHLYQEEDDFGIRKVPIDYGPWEDEMQEVKGVQHGQKLLLVPKGMVWVEGDNPLHSVDSRHYGPISVDSILGKVVYRIWPRRREILLAEDTRGQGKCIRDKTQKSSSSSSSCFMNPTRPHPLTEEEMFSGMYNIAKIPAAPMSKK